MKNVYLILLVIIVLVGGLYFYNKGQKEPLSLGSFGPDPYNATTTVENYPDLKVLKTGWGTLGSVIITEAGGEFILYNATTTDIAAGNDQRSSTSSLLMARFPASAAAGTYTIDAVFTDGLLIDFVSGTIPTTTITWK
jgi:hypothetical protein